MDEEITAAEAKAQSKINHAKTSELAQQLLDDVAAIRTLRIENNWAYKVAAAWRPPMGETA